MRWPLAGKPREPKMTACLFSASGHLFVQERVLCDKDVSLRGKTEIFFFKEHSLNSTCHQCTFFLKQ
jgi:hypothetical protein